MRRRALASLAVWAAVIVPLSAGAQALPPPRPPSGSVLRAPGDFARIGDPTARAAAIFVEAGKVLQHPRCLNCHPDGDRPTQGIGYPHQPPVQRGDDGLGVSAMRCTTCHQAVNFEPARVPGNAKWRLAPASMAWQRRSLVEICALLKHDPLVGWAWSPGGYREPAPGTQADFGALIRAWADAGAACPAR